MEFFPPMRVLELQALDTPDYKRPNHIPLAVVQRAVIDPKFCDEIITEGLLRNPDRFHNCNAVTRIFNRPTPSAVHAVERLTLAVNSFIWQYKLDNDAPAAMQTYEIGDSYPAHMDTVPGQSRKLTALVMLSDPADYEGGDLILHYHPNKTIIPKETGTVVIFQSHLMHEVTPITKGLRRTMNMGFYGPPFQ